MAEEHQRSLEYENTTFNLPAPEREINGIEECPNQSAPTSSKDEI